MQCRRASTPEPAGAVATGSRYRGVMQEFAAVSASSSNPSALVDRLNEKSAEGWSVVAIVGGAVEVTAFLSREAAAGSSAPSSAAATQPVAAEPGGWATSPTAATVPSAAWSDASAASASTAAAGTSGTAAAGTSSPQMAASSVPAQWAADPTGRYELRYWDGIRWTEHVSRAGQQYTDPL